MGEPAIRQGTGRGAATRFKKGVSGNPSGRPAQFPEFRDKCRQHSPEALARLVAALSEDGAHSIKAAELILAYGWGKPTQVVESEVSGGITLVLDTGIRRADDRRDELSGA